MRHPILVKTLKVISWTLLALAVLIGVLLFCAVKFLNSKEFTPMIERLANEYMDGEVKLGSVKLGFKPRFPILGVEVENLTVISHAFDSLSVEQKGLLPNYADSLLSINHLSGSLDIRRLIINKEIFLGDVSLSGLSVNIVISHDGKANYDVLRMPSDTTSSQKGRMPSFRINRFALDHPREIRFFNAADSTSASVVLLTDAAVDGDRQPTYRLKINGNVTSPKATLLTNLEQIDFGLNGKVYWNPDAPGLIAIDEMELRGAYIKAKVTGEMDLKDSPIIRNMQIDLLPVAVMDLLTLLPDSIRDAYELNEPSFSTDASIEAKLALLEPMNLATDTIPTSRIELSVAPSSVDFGKARFKDLSMLMSINTVKNQPDATEIRLKHFSIAAPGTRLNATALLTTPFADPRFEADVEGEIDLHDLPHILMKYVPGYLSGIISADMRAHGTSSMFKPDKLHHIFANGSLTARDIYFVSADTSKMVEIGTARIKLDSEQFTDGLTQLKANVSVDTATILVSGIDLTLKSVSLSAKSDSESGGISISDTSVMRPIDASLKIDGFNIITLKDRAGARIRSISGPVKVIPLKGNSIIPKLITDLKIGHVSAGTLSDRVVLKDTKVKATLNRQHFANTYDKKASSKKHTGKREFSYISPAAVHRYVYNKRIHGKHTRRVYGVTGSDNDEILIWNLTPQFRRFLNEWALKGAVNSNNGRLLSPIFPLKNYLSDIAIKFNNDTINISEISLKAGKSDIRVTGEITNVCRALTSGPDNSLKTNFSLLSDTIDINELSASVLIGSSVATDRRHGKKDNLESDDDRTLEQRLTELSMPTEGKAAPFLIPVNVDGNLRLQANNVLYSDFLLKEMTSEILILDGGVNVHDLNAYSDMGNLSVSALYSAPRVENMELGFGMKLNDFDIEKFVKLVPAIDSITPLMHDFSGMVSVNLAATCRIDSAMNLELPTLDAAIRIKGDNLAFVDPQKYRTLGKWLGFKNKEDNTIHHLNVEMTVDGGILRVYPFVFNIDRYRLGAYGSNDLEMNFNYHLSVLKSPIPFKFGITISGNPKKYKVRFGGAKFNDESVVQSADIVNHARINLLDQIEGVFKRGVRNSRFSKLKISLPDGKWELPDSGLSASDSLHLIKEGLLDPPTQFTHEESNIKQKKKRKKFWIF